MITGTAKMAPKKKEVQIDRIDELITKLEERLAIFNDGELKKVVLKDLVKLKDLIAELGEVHSHLMDIVGLTYQDVYIDKP